MIIKFIISLIAVITIGLSGFEWIGELFTAHNLANLALVILGLIIASAATQVRLVLEKVENILTLYAKFTHPNSEDGEQLSESERQRLFELFVRELQGLVREFGSGIFAKIGKGIQYVFNTVGLRT
jgi:hypothetical protein